MMGRRGSREGMAGDGGVKDIASLTGESFEVVGHVLSGEVGGGEARIGLCSLFFPAGIK